MSGFIRIWKSLDIDDIKGHLLIVGELTADCSKCRTLGINYSEARVCPKCGTGFKYIASRSKDIKRVANKRPDLIFIDMDDYKRETGKARARDLFSSNG